MPRPDRLARRFLSDALDYHRRKLWNNGAHESPVLVHVPVEDLPVAATLMGRSGEDFGVDLLRGPEAFVAAVRLQYTGDWQERLRCRMVSFTIDRLGEIPPPFRGPLEAAGFRGRRETLAPWVLATTPEGEARPARKQELRLLAWCLRGLLLADDAGELDPPPLDLRDRRVLSIEVTGERLSAARARVAVVPWPEDVSGLEAPVAEPVEDPRTLEEWKAVERAFVECFAADVQEDLWKARALKAYFGGRERAEEVFEELSGLMPEMAFGEWLIADHRPTRRSRTWLERYLERGDLTEAERVPALARQEARLAVVRVLAREPGEWFDVEDVATGRRDRVHDAGLSSSLPEGTFLPLRLLPIGEWVFPTMAGPPFAGHEIDRVLSRLEGAGADLSDLRRTPKLLGLFWRERLEQPTRRELTNTDGEPLHLQSATFTVEDPERIAAALEEREDVHEGDEQCDWIWFRDSGEGTLLLGRLELLDDRLLLEVNSRERLARAREWIEGLPGGARFERATEKEFPEGDLPLDDQLPGPPEGSPPPEMLEQIADLLLERQLAWVDEPVPALGGKTPREACRTKEGRRHVERLVRTMPPVRTPQGNIEPPRERILRELGLE